MEKVIESLKTNYEENKSRISNIKDPKNIKYLFAVFGDKIYDDISDVMKLEPSILKIIFTSYENKALEIFKSFDVNMQDEYISKYPKIYKKLDNSLRTKDSFVKILIKQKQIAMLDDEVKNSYYELISKTIEEDIKLLEFSTIHQNLYFIEKLTSKYNTERIMKYVANNNIYKQLYTTLKEDMFLVFSNNVSVIAKHLANNTLAINHQTIIDIVKTNIDDIILKLIELNPFSKNIDNLFDYCDDYLRYKILQIKSKIATYTTEEQAQIDNEIFYYRLQAARMLKQELSKEDKISLTQNSLVLFILKSLKSKKRNRVNIETIIQEYRNIISNSVNNLVFKNKKLFIFDNDNDANIKQYMISFENDKSFKPQEKKNIKKRMKQDKKLYCSFLEESMFLLLIFMDNENRNSNEVTKCIKDILNELAEKTIIKIQNNHYIIDEDFESKALDVKLNKYLFNVSVDENTILLSSNMYLKKN